MYTSKSLTPVSDDQLLAQRLFALIAPELALVEEEFQRQSCASVQFITTLAEHLRTAGGKRVRPALTILSNYVVGGDAAGLNSIRMATVLEVLHTATLVHDDIIDNAEIRRNRPTIKNLHGSHVATLMGDWFYMSAFETSLAERSLPILTLLTDVTRKMVEGELIQLEMVGRTDITEEQYIDILHRKTAYLFSACCEIGAVLGHAEPCQQEALKNYGMYLGLAFQLIDDLLDFTASDDVLGKATGADLLEGKVTLPLIYLLQSEPAMRDALAAVMEKGAYEAISRRELLCEIERTNALGRAFERAIEFAKLACQELEALPHSAYYYTLLSMPMFILARNH
jgi:octaprenyl-diphosphate synthase